MMTRREAVIVLLTASFTLSLAFGAVTPSFEDVSVRKGLLSFDQIDKKRAQRNKYWGSTIADFDRDGHYDFFVSNHANNAELYFQNPDHSFTYVDPRLYIFDLHATAAADVNNDGYIDFLSNVGGGRGENVNGKAMVHLVKRNQSFVRQMDGKEVRDMIGLGDISHRGRSMMFLDMNADGYLDLLLLNQKNLTATYRHLVYENLGNGKFIYRNNTGIEQSEGYWGQVIDANNDSYPDVLTFRWTGIELWLGTGDFRFEDGTHLIPEAAAGLEKLNLVRCAAEIDFDGDGDLDLILARGSLTPSGGLDDIILENRDGVFVSVSKPLFAEKRDHFHVTVGDFNNDGFVDMYFSVMTQFTEDRKPDWMYLNEGSGRFSLAAPHGTESKKKNSDGDNANAFDYNLDGQLDLLVGSRNAPWKLYENKSIRGSNHYLLVRVGEPRGEIARPYWFRRKALGALVKVSCGGKTFLQRVGSAGQSHSQSYADTVHFGLGQCTRVDSIEIHYPGEVVVKRTGVAVDQLVTIGMYFPCPAGMLGLACDEAMTPCSLTPCRYGQECETIELVGDQCIKQNGCALTGSTAALQILGNSGFESSSFWSVTGSAKYSTTRSSKGLKSMKLPFKYAQTKQFVILEAGVEYTLRCDELGDPIRYKIKKDGEVLWRKFNAPDIPVEGSAFKSKQLIFTPTETGKYEVVIASRGTESGFVDNCMLYTYELAASDRIGEGQDLGDDVLKEGGFEGAGWTIRGGGKLENGKVYEGRNSLALPLSYSDAVQNVRLVKGIEYVMQCFQLDGPVLYRVFKDGQVVAKSSAAAIFISGSAWRTNLMKFKIKASGSYEIRLSTKPYTQGYVDSCTVRPLVSTGAQSSSRQAIERKEKILNRRRSASSSRQAICTESCLKLHCPI